MRTYYLHKSHLGPDATADTIARMNTLLAEELERGNVHATTVAIATEGGIDVIPTFLEQPIQDAIRRAYNRLIQKQPRRR